MRLPRPFAAVALMLVFAISPALGQPPARDQYFKSSPQLLATLAGVVSKPSEFTVRIRNGDKDVALGTIVGADGWVVSKYSELKGDVSVKLKDGRELPAKLVGVKLDHDLAMLKVEAKNLPVADWRDSKEDGVGSWVASPGTGKEPVGVGVISVAARTLKGSGPRFLPNANSGYLGVQMEPVEGSGVKIKEVMKGTGAEKAGLKAGDIVRAIDSATITDLNSMVETLAKKKVGEVVTIKFTREDKPMELKATLGKRDPLFNRGDFQNSMGSTLSERRNGFPAILQHDTVLKPNDCGGPLVDLDGKVVGINIARAGRTESWAIPSEVVRTMLADLETGKYPPPKIEKVSLAPKIKDAEETLKKLHDDKAALEKKIKETEESLKKLKDQEKGDSEKK